MEKQQPMAITVQFLFICLLFLAPLFGSQTTAVAEDMGRISVDSAQLTLSPQSLSRMNSLLGKPQRQPINCWGVSLYTAGFKDEVLPSLKSEMLFYLTSPACRKLAPNENVRAGDIGSVYMKGHGIIHSYNILNPYQIFEKQNPYIERLPQIIQTIEKFGPNVDLRSGCKVTTPDGDGCNWGIVNYRCDVSQIQKLKEQIATQGKPNRERFIFLASALDQAFRAGSPQSISDAFNRYLDFQLDSMKTSDHIQQVISIEGMNRLLLVIGDHLERYKSISKPDHDRFLMVSGKFDEIEARMPAEFEEFPQGELSYSQAK
jgi:hypothetical protein